MSRWILRQIPADGEFLVFGLPYQGIGASSYSRWPRHIGAGRFCAVQPPGRENRIHENVVASHQEYAEQLTEAIAGYLDRPYALIGHCGSVPYVMQTAAHLESRGLPTPRRLFASGWGAPDRGLYGRLSFVDLDAIDMQAEIRTICAALGTPVHEEFVELAAETMIADLRVQRRYRADPLPGPTVPVSVIGWEADDVVPSEQVWPGWPEHLNATFHLIGGGHWEFLRCPPELRELIERQMAGD